MHSVENHSVVIVGGGPVGVTTSLSLAQAGVSSVLLEAREKGAGYPDGRALALSYGTRKILESLGVWEAVTSKATPIQRIHISQKGSFGRSWLKADDYGLPALGYVISYGALSRALDASLHAQSAFVDIRYGVKVTSVSSTNQSASLSLEALGSNFEMDASLAIVADGGRTISAINGMRKIERAYGHDAIVCKIQAQLPHQHVAYERFTSMGPVALLPNGPNEFSLVWTGPTEQISPLLSLSDEAFMQAFHVHFGDRVGQFLHITPRMNFPLKLAYLEPACLPHLAVIGNAAQTMHPVAGQGFNVGLRDADTLAKQIVECSLNHPEKLGSSEMLQEYLKLRQHDTQRGLKFTDMLVSMFSNDILGVSTARSIGLGLFDMLAPVKKHVVSKMSFGR